MNSKMIQSRQKVRTYGRKGCATSSAAAAIFGSRTIPDGGTDTITFGGVDEFDEITTTLQQLTLQRSDAEPDREAKELMLNVERISEPESIKKTSTKTKNLSNAYLAPLKKAYKSARDEKMKILNWSAAVGTFTSVEKIAEASYAEVYRLTNKRGSSILKVMMLKDPEEKSSEFSDRAMLVEDVISEFEIMELVADIEGFVDVKEAFIIQGKPSKSIVNAWRKFESKTCSQFPNPQDVSKSCSYLALELDDAGVPLESFDVYTGQEFVDIFLGLAAALMNAEYQYNFEHRDLHENNVCIKRGPIDVEMLETSQENTDLLGRSGLRVTILDYTLSRATKKDGSVCALNLEKDLSLFHSTAQAGNNLERLQFDTYRKMRALVVLEDRSQTKAVHHRVLVPGNPWLGYKTETNAMWLQYILEFLLTNFKGNKRDLRNCFLVQTDIRKILKDQRWSSAKEIWQWAENRFLTHNANCGDQVSSASR